MQVNNQHTMLHTTQLYARNLMDGAGQILLKKMFFPLKSAEQVFSREIAMRESPVWRRGPGPLGLQSLTPGARPRTYWL